MKNKIKLLPILLTAFISLGFNSACGRRLPTPPAPTVPPNVPPTDPENPEKPPATDPNNPDDGTGDLPKPPDPNQPIDEADFFNLLRLNGYTIQKEEIKAEIQKLAALKITDWSPGTYRDKNKNITEHFKKYGKGFENTEKYVAGSMALAAKTEGIHFYINMSYGNQNNTINLLKVDPKTSEILYYNKSGLISNFAKDTGGLLKLKYAMYVPETVLKPAGTMRYIGGSYNSYYRRF